jgi:hypothetical protein
MLHAALIANIINAVGSTPSWYDREIVPTFPATMPLKDPPAVLNLAPCSPNQIENAFLVIEKPSPAEVRDMRVSQVYPSKSYSTIGQLFRTIEGGLERLSRRGGLFDHARPNQQLSKKEYYAVVKYNEESSGGLIEVFDIATAREAIQIVVHQGEGVEGDEYADENQAELTHYHKFLQLQASFRDEVYPLKINAKSSDYTGDLKQVNDLFNAGYSLLLLTLDEIYHTSDASSQDALNKRIYMIMEKVMRPCAYVLTESKLPDGTHAAPTFELFEFRGIAEQPKYAVKAMIVAAIEMNKAVVSRKEFVEALGKGLEKWK